MGEGEHFTNGPIIGILCNPKWDAKKSAIRFSSQLQGLKKMLDVGRACGATCYLFRIQDVDFKKQKVTGYMVEDQGFVQRTLPMPDVIYDQLISRKLERNQKLHEKRQALSRMYGRKIFNDGFFDKWQVHAWLAEEPKMRTYLLDTIPHTTTVSAVAFLQKYATVFLKPLHGSLGLGIVRISKQPNGSYLYDVKRGTKAASHGNTKSALDVVKVFERRIKSRPYLWQQGITLLSYKDRPVDLRILMQRDGTGEWKRTKLFARVARSGEFTSNLSSGGEALPVGWVLQELRESTQAKCRRQIMRVSKLAIDALEKQSGKTYGELGIDLGIDKNGGVWVIEINSKPRKTPTTEKGRQDLVDLAFERPIRYAIRLATTK